MDNDKTLSEILAEIDAMQYAVAAGSDMHKKLQYVFSGDGSDIAKLRIDTDAVLRVLFDQNSQTEVPIAGHINGRFVSRRIDRLRIDDNARRIDIIDYKTDIDKNARRSHYVHQLSEYRQLLSQIYPQYKIRCFILWLHDWTLENIG